MDAFDVAKNINKKTDVSAEQEIKYCPNCGSELENKDKCEKCGCIFGEIKEIKELKKNYKLKFFKKFILKYGRIIIDIDTGLIFLLAILIGIFFLCAFFNSYLPNKEWYFEFVPYAPLWLLLAIIAPIIIIFFLIFYKFFVYLLIDIRDTLKNIEENTSKKD